MKTTFTFLAKHQLVYGFGATRQIGELLDQAGYGDIVLFVDEGVAKYSEYYHEIHSLLERSKNLIATEVIRGSQEPDYDYLDQVAGRIREIERIDVIVAIGGGSCLDVAKGAAVLKTNPGMGIEYRGFDKVKRPGIPVIAIPSTAGTGSEATVNAVFIDSREKRKLGINGRYVNATCAVLDAAWTMSCPQSAAVSAGMDAMVHALESYMCQQANQVTRMYSREAFGILYRNLPCLVDDPTNKDRRQNILLGAYLAATALFNSGSGVAGALSYPIGVHFRVPHGMAGGIFIASVAEFNVNKGYREYADLISSVEDVQNLCIEEKNYRFVDAMKALASKLMVPTYLDGWGIHQDNVAEVAKLMLPLQAAFNQNPVPFSAKEDVPAMLRRHVAPG